MQRLRKIQTVPASMQTASFTPICNRFLLRHDSFSMIGQTLNDPSGRLISIPFTANTIFRTNRTISAYAKYLLCFLFILLSEVKSEFTFKSTLRIFHRHTFYNLGVSYIGLPESVVNLIRLFYTSTFTYLLPIFPLKLLQKLEAKRHFSLISY